MAGNGKRLKKIQDDLDADVDASIIECPGKDLSKKIQPPYHTADKCDVSFEAFVIARRKQFRDNDKAGLLRFLDACIQGRKDHRADNDAAHQKVIKLFEDLRAIIQGIKEDSLSNYRFLLAKKGKDCVIVLNKGVAPGDLQPVVEKAQRPGEASTTWQTETRPPAAAPAAAKSSVGTTNVYDLLSAEDKKKFDAAIAKYETDHDEWETKRDQIDAENDRKGKEAKNAGRQYKDKPYPLEPQKPNPKDYGVQDAGRRTRRKNGRRHRKTKRRI